MDDIWAFLKDKEKSVLVNPFSHSTKTTDIEPHNPAHHPHKSHDEYRQCNPGGGEKFALLLGFDNSYTTPSKISLVNLFLTNLGRISGFS